MTPASRQLLAPSRARMRELLMAVLGVLLLATLFLPARGPVTRSVALEWRPSAELAGVLFLIAMAALAGPRLVAGRGVALALALLVAGAALLNLANAATSTSIGISGISRRSSAWPASRRACGAPRSRSACSSSASRC